MKKTLLISTALFLSVASFAQTSAGTSGAVKGETNIQHNNAGNQVNSSANATSATTIHTTIVKDARDGSTDQIKEDNQAMAAEKQALAADAKTKGQQTASTASKGRSTATSANAKAKDATSFEDNNLDENASLNDDEHLSSSTDNNGIGKTKSAENENFHATLKGDNRSQVAVDKTAAHVDHKIKTTSASTVHTANAHSIRIKPIPVKASAHIKTGAAIRIGG